MLTKRTNVLFEEDEYSRLAALARAKKVTVGHLIRNAVEKVYDSKTVRANQWAMILSETRRLMKGVRISAKEWKEFINEGRKW